MLDILVTEQLVLVLPFTSNWQHCHVFVTCVIVIRMMQHVSLRNHHLQMIIVCKGALTKIDEF